MSDLQGRHHAERARMRTNLPLLHRIQIYWEITSIRRYFNPENRESFYLRVSSFLQKGVPVRVIAERLHETYAKKNPNCVEAKFYQHWLSGIKRGWSTSFIMSEFFPSSEVMIVAAGEDSGEIVNAFNRCAVSATQTMELSGVLSSIKASLFTYLGMIFLVAIGFSISFQTQMARIFTPDRMLKLGGATRSFIEFSSWVYQRWAIVIIAVVGLVILYQRIRTNYLGKYRSILDRYPPFIFYRISEGVGFLVALQALMESGKTLKQASEVMWPHASRYTREHLKQIQKLVQIGRTDGQALDTGLLMSESVTDAELFSSTSDLANSVPMITKNAMRTATRKAKFAQSILKIVTMAVMACFVCWMFIANMGMGDAFKR